MTAKRITAALLREYHACEEQVAIFEAEWPDGAEPTEANLQRANNLGLAIGWLCNLLRDPYLTAYEAARDQHWAAYDAACAQSRAACAAARGPYLDAHKAARDQHWAAYKAAYIQARSAHEAVCDQHWAIYRAMRGVEFIRQWKLQEADEVPA